MFVKILQMRDMELNQEKVFYSIILNAIENVH